MRIRRAEGREAASVEKELAQLLVDCVADGASLGFFAELSVDDALAWWRQWLADPRTLVWVAFDEADAVVGTVSLQLAPYPTSAHRASVAKLMVHPRARRNGRGVALMAALEAEALRRGRTLLVLDTETGSPAEPIYGTWGWQRIGTIEDYARAPDGRLTPTTIMAKRLDNLDNLDS